MFDHQSNELKNDYMKYFILFFTMICTVSCKISNNKTDECELTMRSNSLDDKTVHEMGMSDKTIDIETDFYDYYFNPILISINDRNYSDALTRINECTTLSYVLNHKSVMELLVFLKEEIIEIQGENTDDGLLTIITSVMPHYKDSLDKVDINYLLEPVDPLNVVVSE